MATFTVHVPPGVADDAARADGTVFVREGFAWGCFLLGPLALLYRGLWRAALAWAAAAVLLFALAALLGLGGPARLALYLVLAALTGLEAPEARRRALGRAGFIPAALLCGVDRDEGERVFFGGAGPMSMPLRASGAARAGAGPGFGLFPRGGGRA